MTITFLNCVMAAPVFGAAFKAARACLVVEQIVLRRAHAAEALGRDGGLRVLRRLEFE
jgi:hypothetical protein